MAERKHRAVRMGIDVGGTYTKCVAMDNETHEIIGKNEVKTTHDDKNGVAAGVVQSFQNCMRENDIAPEDVVFVAHSTTQATNAFIEGDVANVGVVGVAGGGLEGFLAKRQLALKDIVLDEKVGRMIKVFNTFIKKKMLTEEVINKNIDDLISQGAQVIVASMAFGVDSMDEEMMRLNGYIDVLIPRGGAGLIQSVVQNSTVPVIETGTGNCHTYVDKSADLDMAVRIVINAKTQRPGVCNACESLLVHEDIAETFIPMVVKALKNNDVEIRGDERFSEEDGVKQASEEDWGTEYNDLIISAKVVKDIDEAIEHIRKYSTGHSECIVTENYTNAQKFLDEVDAAAVYVNASTRFTDGGQFGFGAEIGISTQKLHARGPMGLKEITTTKYIIYGNGQIR